MHDKLALQTTYIPHLRKQMENGALVLFTGAGFSLDGRATNGFSLPSVNRLIEQLWELCWPGESPEDETQLQDVFEHALLSHRSNLDKLLRTTFTADAGEKQPQWYSELLAMPWLRMYTLNIDDLSEKIVDSLPGGREPNTVSARSGAVADLSDDKFDIIHLNGALADIPEQVTFARSQYAERIDNDAFYEQFRADLISRPMVFIGSGLDEGPLWEHVVARRSRGARSAQELRPRSYLVTPGLNRSKEALLSKFNIVWLKMTGAEFNEQVLMQLSSAKKVGLRALVDRGLVKTDERTSLDLVGDLLQRTSPPSEYLLGQEPTWADIVNERAAKRACFDDLWEKTKAIRARAAANEFIVLTGTAGSGKSTALMWIAHRLNQEGYSVAWMDSNAKYTYRDITTALSKLPSLDALLINSSDIYGARLSSMIKSILDRQPRLLIIAEARSAKVDSLIKPIELGPVAVHEATMPNLTNDDIDAVLNVLERENRLGVLRGKSKKDQREAFERGAGRQLLVAMYEATSGNKFEERAADELNDLAADERLVYGIVSAASAYRFKLTRDEILIACGDTTNNALNNVEKLVRRKLINNAGGDLSSVISRHRVIAEMVYNALVRNGEFERVLRGLFMVCVAKTTANIPKTTRLARLLYTVINHNYIRRTVGSQIGRMIYGEFEDGLAWHSHYWLHRGALELETGNLSLAENFINQAMNLNPNDLFVESEWTYLLFKKANANPLSKDSPDLVDEACRMIEAIIIRSPEQSAHPYHILGSQGLGSWPELDFRVLSSRRHGGMP